MYYKMINVQRIKINLNESTYRNLNKEKKKRVEIKCKRLNKNKYLVILKDVTI